MCGTTVRVQSPAAAWLPAYANIIQYLQEKGAPIDFGCLLSPLSFPSTPSWREPRRATRTEGSCLSFSLFRKKALTKLGTSNGSHRGVTFQPNRHELFRGYKRYVVHP